MNENSPSESGRIRPWKLLETRARGDFRIFSLRSDVKVSPRSGVRHDFIVLEAADWVNVVAVTSQEEIILVEQFRHGTNTVELEIPGGVMDPQDPSPVAAGERELREETGYAGSDARIIGSVAANPAIMNNTCFTVLVENCVLQHPTQLDATEDLVTRLVPVREIPKLVRRGRFRHSLVVAALYHYHVACGREE